MARQGKFITFEGIEGAGKTTAIDFIKQYLIDHGIEIVLTREPGGTEVAEAIRKILLDHNDEKIAEDAELLLFFASRAQHIAQVIKPALNAGKIVLCDRFTDASFAYQCGGRGIDEKRVEVLESWVHADLQPDLTILMDLPVEVGMQRATKRGELDRFEVEQHHFFEKVREHYLYRAKKYPHRFQVVNADVTIDEIKDVLQDIVDKNIIGEK